jgi:hypothetical protein
MELTKYVKPYRVTCDKFRLGNVDPGDTLDLDIGKAEAKEKRAVPRKGKSNLRLPRLPSAVRPVRGYHQANPRRRPSIALSDFARNLSSEHDLELFSFR